MVCVMSRLAPGVPPGMSTAMCADARRSGDYSDQLTCGYRGTVNEQYRKARLRSTPVAAAMAGLRAAGCTASGRFLSHPVSTSWVRSIRLRRIGGPREECLVRGDAPSAAQPRGDAHRSAGRKAGVDAQQMTCLRGQEGLRRTVACEHTGFPTTDGHSRQVIAIGDGAAL
jgi:hypothetical protein